MLKPTAQMLMRVHDARMFHFQTNVEHLTEKMKKDIQRGLVLRYTDQHSLLSLDTHGLLRSTL